MKAGDKIRAWAPATIANLSCGYDVMGLALDAPGDEVEVEIDESGEIRLEIVGDGGLLPKHVEKNLASAMVQRFLISEQLTQFGARVRLHKNLPLNSGMGSSSSSAVAALTAINHLAGQPYSPLQLLPAAMDGERIACGNAHADNVAPALLGGVVLIRDVKGRDVVQLPFPDSLRISLVHPHIDVPTSESRLILKPRVAIPEAVQQWANVGGLVAGFCTGDIPLIGRSLEDVIFEPVRSMLIPGFYDMKDIAMDAGAIGFGISGSGPSVFALSNDEQVAKEISLKLHKYLKSIGIDNEHYTSGINQQGAKVL